MKNYDIYENTFVTYLNKYTTVSSEHEAAFDEYISQNNWSNELKIDTQTQEFVIHNFMSNEPRTIILTGNAGDGKTYLCRKVIEAVTGETFIDWESLTDTLNLPGSGLQLRVIKDLSELGEEAGGDKLREIYVDYMDNQSSTVTLAAANEGRLRALLTQNQLTELYEDVDNQLRYGTNLNSNRGLIIINLNAATTSSYVDQSLHWMTQSENWMACEGCPAFSYCPIRYNAEKLREPLAIRRIKNLYQIFEQLNEHATIRDMLIHLAFVITAGLRCHQIIEKRNDQKWKDNLHEYVYYQNIWGISASSSFRSKVTVINFLRKLDVGKNSVFEIDDFVLNGDTTSDLSVTYAAMFNEALDLNWKRFKQDRDAYVRSGTSSPNPQNKYAIMQWLPHCRRKLFFEWDESNYTNRLFPLLYVSRYFQLVSNQSPVDLETALENIVLGLNRAFSGLFLTQSDNLFVTSQYAHAVEQPVPIVQFQIPTTYIELKVRDSENKAIDCDIATLELIIPPPPRIRADELRWSINLLMFEYLVRRANGSTPNVLANECELEIRHLKDELLEQFGDQAGDSTISFFAADENRYTLRRLQLEKRSKK